MFSKFYRRLSIKRAIAAFILVLGGLVCIPLLFIEDLKRSGLYEEDNLLLKAISSESFQYSILVNMSFSAFIVMDYLVKSAFIPHVKRLKFLSNLPSMMIVASQLIPDLIIIGYAIPHQDAGAVVCLSTLRFIFFTSASTLYLMEYGGKSFVGRTFLASFMFFEINYAVAATLSIFNLIQDIFTWYIFAANLISFIGASYIVFPYLYNLFKKGYDLMTSSELISVVVIYLSTAFVGFTYFILGLKFGFTARRDTPEVYLSVFTFVESCVMGLLLISVKTIWLKDHLKSQVR